MARGVKFNIFEEFFFCKFRKSDKLGRVIFGKINSRIQTLTLGNYLFIIQLLKTQSLLTDDRVVGHFYRDKHF
jgi:hypothetical protein